MSWVISCPTGELCGELYRNLCLKKSYNDCIICFKYNCIHQIPFLVYEASKEEINSDGKYTLRIHFDFKEQNNKTKLRIVYLYVWALLSWILRQLQVKPEVKRSHFWTVFVKGYFSSSSWLFHVVVDIIISDRNFLEERAKDILFLMDNEETC